PTLGSTYSTPIVRADTSVMSRLTACYSSGWAAGKRADLIVVRPSVLPSLLQRRTALEVLPASDRLPFSRDR
ncbi:MAG: hypothetical protein ABR549_19075, partial [Mycobacteriales bacterium]